VNPDLDFVFARRSVRAYRDQPVPEARVRDLLEAAMAAPSAVCKDPWHFVVLREQRTRQLVAECLPNGKMLGQAPLGFVICGDTQAAHDGELSYLLQDCSAAVENLLLAAAALGLGACWLGVHPRADRIRNVSEILNLPDHILPIAAVAMGWPTQAPSPRTRFREEAVHNECW